MGLCVSSGLPQDQHSSPPWWGRGAPSPQGTPGAGSVCPAWAGVRQGEQGLAAHPAPVSPSLRPLPETVIEIGCGRRARDACRAPRWAAQPCHTSCRHHPLPSPPAPARASISAAPMSLQPAPHPAKALLFLKDEPASSGRHSGLVLQPTLPLAATPPRVSGDHQSLPCPSITSLIAHHWLIWHFKHLSPFSQGQSSALAAD